MATMTFNPTTEEEIFDLMEQEGPSTLIFVYGSLKRNGHNHYLLEYADYLGEDIILAKNVSTTTLAAIVEGEDTILGELYRCSPWIMWQVDQLEGVSYGLYEKREVETLLGHKAYAYFAGRFLYSSIKRVNSIH